MKTRAPDRLIFLAVLVDLLFLPFLLPVPVPLSFALLPVWFLSMRAMPQPRYLVAAVIGATIAVASFIAGYNTNFGGTDLNLQRAANTAIVVFMFGAYLCASVSRVGDCSPIFRILRAYIAFAFFLAALFFIDPASYFSVRSFWTFSDAGSSFDGLSILTRYTGILSDPNNAAVLSCAIAAFVVFYEPNRTKQNLGALAMTGVVVIASMSATGVICFSVLIAAYVMGTRRSLASKVFLIVAAGAVAAIMYELIRDTEVYRLAVDRIADSDANSRFSRWERAADWDKFMSSVLLGDGGSIYLRGREYRPHNGHIHLAYSFGLFCYLAFVAVFFKVRRLADWRHWVFLAILLIGFTVNVGVYEHRFAGAWALLMAMHHRMATSSRPKRRQPEVTYRRAVVSH